MCFTAWLLDLKKEGTSNTKKLSWKSSSKSMESWLVRSAAMQHLVRLPDGICCGLCGLITSTSDDGEYDENFVAGKWRDMEDHVKSQHCAACARCGTAAAGTIELSTGEAAWWLKRSRTRSPLNAVRAYRREASARRSNSTAATLPSTTTTYTQGVFPAWAERPFPAPGASTRQRLQRLASPGARCGHCFCEDCARLTARETLEARPRTDTVKCPATENCSAAVEVRILAFFLPPEESGRLEPTFTCVACGDDRPRRDKVPLHDPDRLAPRLRRVAVTTAARHELFGSGTDRPFTRTAGPSLRSSSPPLVLAPPTLSPRSPLTSTSPTALPVATSSLPTTPPPRQRTDPQTAPPTPATASRTASLANQTTTSSMETPPHPVSPSAETGDDYSSLPTSSRRVFGRATDSSARKRRRLERRPLPSAEWNPLFDTTDDDDEEPSSVSSACELCAPCAKRWLEIQARDGVAYVRCPTPKCRVPLSRETLEVLLSPEAYAALLRRARTSFESRLRELQISAKHVAFETAKTASEQAKQSLKEEEEETRRRGDRGKAPPPPRTLPQNPASSSSISSNNDQRSKPAAAAGASAVASTSSPESEEKEKDDDDGTAAFLRWAGDATRACPECHVIIYRSEGCSHISCACGADFNWDWAERIDGSRPAAPSRADAALSEPWIDIADVAGPAIAPPTNLNQDTSLQRALNIERSRSAALQHEIDRLRRRGLATEPGTFHVASRPAPSPPNAD